MHSRSLPFVAYVALCLGGCPAIPGQDCEQDFDCDVGFVCKGDPQHCTEAGPGEERTFGAQPVEFTSGDEAYLLSVFLLPQGPSAPDALGRFSLAATDGGGGALRLHRGTAPGQVDFADWQSRVAFDHERHAQVDALVDAVRAGERSLYNVGGRTHGCGGCDNSSFCDGNSCVPTHTFKFTDGTDVPATLVTVLTSSAGSVNVLLDDALSGVGGATTTAETVAQAFVDQWGRVQSFLGQSNGHTGDLDVNHDDRLTILFTNKTAANVPLSNVGFFDSKDFLTTGGTGNATDMLWVRLPGTQSGTTEAIAAGTLVHEYTHLVSYAVRVAGRPNDPQREELWLDEGLAHLMEDLAGFGPSNVANVAAALADWSFAGFGRTSDVIENVDTPPQRGQAYLLLRHIIDTQAGSQGASDAADNITESSAATVVTQLLTEPALGFEHAAFGNLGPQGIGDWLVGVYATGDDFDVTVPEAHAFDYLKPALAPTNELVGIDTHGTFPLAEGGDVVLDGPEETPAILGVDVLEDNEINISGSIFYVLTVEAPGSFQLEGRGEAALDFHMRVERIR